MKYTPIALLLAALAALFAAQSRQLRLRQGGKPR